MVTIKKADWEYLRKYLEREKPQRILEFGTGLSTMLFGKYAVVDSYETMTRIVVAMWNLGLPNVNVYPWDNESMVDGSYDFAFVDGAKPRGRQVEIAQALAPVVGIHDYFSVSVKPFIDKYLSGYDLDEGYTKHLKIFRDPTWKTP
jgi:hypothetical protein